MRKMIKIMFGGAALVFLLLTSKVGFAGTNANVIKPETTPPPAEGALELKDLEAVFSRPLPEQPRIVEKKVEVKKEEKKVVIEDDEKQAKNQQPGFDLMPQENKDPGIEKEMNLDGNRLAETENTVNEKELGVEKEINMGEMKAGEEKKKEMGLGENA